MTARLDLASTIVRRRRWVVFGWIACGAALLPRAAGVGQQLAVSPRAASSEAAIVEAQLATRFETPYVNYAVLLVSGAPLPTERRGRVLLDTLLAHVAAVPGVLRVRGYESPRDTLFLVPAAKTSFAVVGLDGVHQVPEDVVPTLRAATAALLPDLSARFPGIHLRWTGRAVLYADLRRASGADVSTAERRALPATLLFLVAAFGTLVAALVPVGSGALAIAIALGLAGLIAAHWPLAAIVQGFLTMVGLGLGIDFALLIVSRFREGLAEGRSAQEAALEATRRAGHTVAVSGTAVALGFVALFAVPHPQLRSVAVGGLLAAGAAVLVSTTFVPAVLAWIGPAIHGGRVLGARWTDGFHARWRRWGRWVTRRPVVVLVAAGAPVAALAWQARRLSVGLPQGGDWLPPRMESAVALRDLQAMGRSGVVQTVSVLVELPERRDVLTPSGWTAVRRVRERLLADPRIAGVFSFNAFGTDRPLSRLAFFTTPRAMWRQYLTPDRRLVLLQAVPKESVDPTALVALVNQLRALDPTHLTQVAGIRIRIGGLPAFRADYLNAIGGRLPMVMTLVLTGTFVSLLLAFRSVLVPLKAITLNLLAVGAGFGAVVLVFQDGYGVGLFGLTERVDHVFAELPLIVFCTVFGLSMDYEVFLVTRVAEARRRMANESAALVEGLAHTGPVITSAAAVMVVVFGAFTLGDFLLIKMLGLALAIAVLVDATVVRSAIGPALLTLAGRWNWWPGDRGHAVPHGRSR